jgi:hypothetical protein
LPTQNRRIRLFVSSTFRNMMADRDEKNPRISHACPKFLATVGFRTPMSNFVLVLLPRLGNSGNSVHGCVKRL